MLSQEVNSRIRVLGHADAVVDGHTHQPAAVYRQQRAVHVRTTWAGQQEDGCHHFLGPAGPSRRAPLGGALGLVVDVVRVLAGGRASHFRGEDARADGVDTDVHPSRTSV